MALETWRNFKGRGPKTTGAVLIRDAWTMKPLFIMCFYDPPIPMAGIMVDGKRIDFNQPTSGGDMIRRALKKRGLNHEDFSFTLWETADSSSV